MTGDSGLRGAIIGLLSFAAAEEQILLAAADPTERGDAVNWAAVPLVAHNTEFKRQQAALTNSGRLGTLLATADALTGLPARPRGAQ